MASQTESSEFEALRARCAALEERCAAYESNEVVDPYVAANAKLERQCGDLRDRCGQLERENATLSLSLAYFHTQLNDDAETIASEPTPQKAPPSPGVIEWGDEEFASPNRRPLGERLDASSFAGGALIIAACLFSSLGGFGGDDGDGGGGGALLDAIDVDALL